RARHRPPGPRRSTTEPVTNALARAIPAATSSTSAGRPRAFPRGAPVRFRGAPPSAAESPGNRLGYAVTLARNAARLTTFRSTCSARVSLSLNLTLEAVNFLPRVYSEHARSPQK